MPSVLVTPICVQHKRLPYLDVFGEAGFEVHYAPTLDLPMGKCTEQQTIGYLRPFDAIVAGGEYVSENVAHQLPNMKVIARFGVGYDRINVNALTQQRIALTITPTANLNCVAEHTLSLIFATAKQIPQHNAAVRSVWTQVITQPLRGSTIGIIGLGRIGKAVAQRCAQLGMRVIAFETFPDQQFVQQYEITLLDFDALLEQSDFVSVHCPSTEATRQMFDRRVFEKMKPGSTFINTARGDLVVESDLVASLESGHLKAAGLDVFEQEPTPADNPLLKFDNVVCTPHMGGMDSKSVEDMAMESAQCIVKLHQGEWPEGAVVNEALRKHWKWKN